MRRSFRYVLLGFIALIILSNAQHGGSGTAGSNSPGSGIISSATTRTPFAGSPVSIVTAIWRNGTCPSRTANYITHTLPQQCLRTDRANATKRIGVDETGPISSDSSIPFSSGAFSTDDAGASPTGEPSTEAASSVNEPGESDSPLDNANFLSFEEWKRQNQAKAEQAAEQGNLPYGGDRQRPGINNALDSLGEEGEIELDFSGFGGDGSVPRQQQAAYRTADGGAPDKTAPTSHTPRSKDAGKTCKERTNYASFDCAAAILKHNPECKSASSVLVENKDSYMLNTCSANNKFFIVELCNDILIDTVVLANYEFFSSIFRRFRVSVSDRYPVKMDKWRDLGTFEARNTREVQAFLIEHPQVWARYLRIEFLSHYGSEYYCPVSLLRVHGTTMLEEIRPQEEIAQGESADDVATLEAEATAIPAIPQEPDSSTDEAEKATVQAISSVEDVPSQPSSVETDRDGSMTTVDSLETSEAEPLIEPSLTWTVNITGVLTSLAIPLPTETTCAFNKKSLSSDPPSRMPSALGSIEDTRETVETKSAGPNASSNDPELSSAVKTSTAGANTGDGVTAVNGSFDGRSATDAMNGTSMSTSAPGSTPSSLPPTAGANDKQIQSVSMAHPSSGSTTRSTPSSSSSIAQPQPSTQESFFKSIHKRLQQLEANSTLSLQYIEEQSRILRDAFSKVEKRQISGTTAFLANLNETVMAELRGFRQAYDQLWQGTVIELESQREQYHREIVALSTRLSLVADELVWQKRMGIAQSTLLLLCLGLVLFARTGQAGYLEVPLLQQMRNKSYTALSQRVEGWESPDASPSPESRSPVRLLRRKLMWRSYTEPSVSTDSRPGSKDGPPSTVDPDVDVKVEPPTPESDSVDVVTPETEYEDVDDGVTEDIREVQSSPPTPTGERERRRDVETIDWVGGGVGVT